MSNCQTGQCVQNWPALVAPSGTISLGTGLKASDFSTLTRTDGTAQVTFKTIPLYNFAGDSAPGDKNGDGVGGIWHVATTSTRCRAASIGPSAPAASRLRRRAPAVAAGRCLLQLELSNRSVPIIGRGGFPVSRSRTSRSRRPATSSARPADRCTNSPVTRARHQRVHWGLRDQLAGADNRLRCDARRSAADSIRGLHDLLRSDDSSNQVEYYGKPLYYYAGDTAPGDTKGDGVSLWTRRSPSKSIAEHLGWARCSASDLKQAS